MVDVNGVERLGNLEAQSAAMSPERATASTSYASPSVTTSASSPSMTARACLARGRRCDWRTVILLTSRVFSA